MSRRPAGRLRVQNQKQIERPLTKREIRVFFMRMALLCAATAGVYWLGWRSPWARADTNVKVEMPDAPKALPVVTEPPKTVVSEPSAGPASDGPSSASESKRDKMDDQAEADSPKPKKRVTNAHK